MFAFVLRRVALFGLLPLSCLAPTEITLEITTDALCADLHGVAITVGAPDQIETMKPATVTSVCAANDAGAQTIGSLAVAPGAMDGVLGIRVVAGFKRSVDECAAPYGDGCIVARRSLRYVPHTPLYLPIDLSVSCAGVPCDPKSTCVNGVCKPADVSDPTTCATPSACAPDGGPAPTSFDPLCGDTSGLAVGASWPMTDVCPTHIARTPSVGPKTKPSIVWSYATSSTNAVYSAPIVTADGTVFFGAPDGTATALDLQGHLSWSTLVANEVLDGNAAVGADGTLVVAGGNAVYGFDSVTHARRWTSQGRGGDVTIGAGEIVYEGAQSTLRALDGATGAELWNVPLTGTQPAANFYAPAISVDGALVYVGADDGTLAAIDPKSHALVWSRTLAGGGSPLALGGGVVVPTRSSDGIVDYDADDTLRWSYPGTTNYCAALAKDGTIATTNNNLVLGLDASTGTKAWAVPSPNDIVSCLVVDGDGVIYGITSQDDLVAIDPTQPAGPIWLLTIKGAITVVLAKDGTLLVATGDGHVHGVR